MKKKRIFLNGLLAAAFLFALQACNNSQNNTENETTPGLENMGVEEVAEGEELHAHIHEDVEYAVCVLQPTEGNDVSGTVTFIQTDNGVRVVADVQGLTPGNHGFHIHQYGDITAPDGTSAGGHYNPDGLDHGGPNDEVRHIGDMGNLEAGEDGVAHLDYTDEFIELSGAHSVVGRAIIVHAGEDDLTSQPTGAAGARVAYGVIGIGNLEN